MKNDHKRAFGLVLGVRTSEIDLKGKSEEKMKQKGKNARERILQPLSKIFN